MAPFLRSRLAVALLTALLAAAAVTAMRTAGLLESLELGAYDRFLSLRSDRVGASRVLVVGHTEHDIMANQDYPLPDARLARIVAAIAAHGPRAIGVDFFRDVPVQEGREQLDALLLRDDRIVMIHMMEDEGSPAIPPPPVLVGSSQVGFADVKLDRDDTIRRALLYADDEDGEPLLSLSMQMALRWLHGEGVGLSVDDQERLVLGSTPLPRLEPDTGAYVGTDAGGYQTLIDWDGRTPHESLSFTRLLANDFDPALIRDRMVFVGALAESVSDLRRSPFGLWAGVYIHAHIASQLVRYGTGEDEPLVSASEGVELAWIALWALLGAGFGLLRSSVPLLVVGGLAGLALLAAGGHVGMQAGLWLPIVPPSLSWLIAAGGVTAYLSRAERAERDSLMGLFSRHVSEDVARELWERRDEFSEGGRPKPQRQCVTVAFFDVRGFTPIAERLGPLRVTEWVNELMNALAEETERHGGFVDDYFGDGMKAAFGVPVARTEPEMQRADAVASVEAALAARRRLEQLNRRWNAEGLPTGHVRVGIHTGFVVAASIGSATRLKYTVLGDAVNTAARIEALDDGGHDFDARPARILVSQATLDRLAGAFDAKPLGEFALKGKEERVQVHEILGRAS